jgi:hypothetical protein
VLGANPGVAAAAPSPSLAVFEEIAVAYGQRPQFRGLSVNDMNAYQAAGRSPMILTGRH